MSEDWKTAFEAWLTTPTAPQHGAPLGSLTLSQAIDRASENSFRAGYLAQAETVERLRGALDGMVEAYWRGSEDSEDDEAPEAVKAALKALADLQPKPESKP